MTQVLDERVQQQDRPVKIYIKNKPTNALIKNPITHEKSKHIEKMYHFI